MRQHPTDPLFAGTLILLSLAFGVPSSLLLVNVE
jgi:hypothetical protein